MIACIFSHHPPGPRNLRHADDLPQAQLGLIRKRMSQAEMDIFRLRQKHWALTMHSALCWAMWHCGPQACVLQKPPGTFYTKIVGFLSLRPAESELDICDVF